MSARGNSCNSRSSQTVALTAISIGVGAVWQAANVRAAQEMLNKQPFGSAVIAIEASSESGEASLSMIELIRNRRTASPEDIPLYVLVERKLSVLDVQRVLIKPFKARVLIEVLSTMVVEPTAVT